MTIDYTRVYYFLTVVKYMNMNKAAQELFISQPALSMSISKLETEFGFSLFYRDKNKLLLSSEAEELMPLMESFRNAHDQLAARISDLVLPHALPINLSFTGSFYLFTSLYMAPFMRSYKGSSISISHVTIDQAKNMLLTHQTDLAISCYPITHSMISSIIIHTEPVGVVLPVKNPYTKYSSITPQLLEQIPINGLTEHHAFRVWCDQVCAENHTQINYISSCEYDEYYARMDERDPFSGFLSTYDNYTLNFEPSQYYTYVPIDIPNLNRQIGIYYLTDDKKNYRYKDFIEIIQKNYINQGQYTRKLSHFLNEDYYDSPE